MTGETHLVVVDGGRERPLAGEDVLHEVGLLIADKLPLVPYDDPYRGTLHALALSAGIPLIGGAGS